MPNNKKSDELYDSKNDSNDESKCNKNNMHNDHEYDQHKEECEHNNEYKYTQDDENKTQEESEIKQKSELEISNEQIQILTQQLTDAVQKFEDEQQQSAQWKEKYLLQLANQQNSEKRQVQMLDVIRNRTIEKFAQEIAPLLDVLLSVNSTVTSTDVKQGLDMVCSKFIDALDSFQIKVMDIKIGDVPDHGLHHVIGQEDSSVLTGMITKVVSNGFTITGRLLIPAKVMVSSNKNNTVNKDIA